MSADDRERWDAKYREGHAEEHGSTELRRWVYRLKRGRALDLACGLAPAAAFLHELGWAVAGVDISAVGLAQTRRKHPDLPLIRADLDRFRVREGSLDTIVCTYFLDRDRIAEWMTWLGPGGTLYLETFTVDELKYRPTFRRNFLLDRAEVQDLAGQNSIVHVDEIDDGTKAYAVLLLRR